LYGIIFLIWFVYELITTGEPAPKHEGLKPIFGPNHLNEQDKYLAHAAMFLNIDE
jgi:hypothetical protein